MSRRVAGTPDAQPLVMVCPDKFRGSLTARQAASSLAAGLQAGGVSRLQILPAADGGEGTVDCCLAAGFTELRQQVTGADGHTVLARIATRGELAVIESAQACGLLEGAGNPHAALAATSFGVGELIGAALDRGCRKLIVGVLGVDDLAVGAQLVVTGGGSLDTSSLGGKAPVTLARREHRRGTPVIIVVGQSTLSPGQRRQAGIDQIYQLVDLAGSSEQSMRNAPLLLHQTGEQIAKWFTASLSTSRAPGSPAHA